MSLTRKERAGQGGHDFSSFDSLTRDPDTHTLQKAVLSGHLRNRCGRRVLFILISVTGHDTEAAGSTPTSTPECSMSADPRTTDAKASRAAAAGRWSQKRANESKHAFKDPTLPHSSMTNPTQNMPGKPLGPTADHPGFALLREAMMH